MLHMKKPAILVCLQCGSTQPDANGCKVPNPKAAALAEDIRHALTHTHPAQAAKLEVKLVRCLVQCDEPIAWGLRADALYNYVFAGGDDPAAIAALAARWVEEANHGCMPARTMPPLLRKKLRGRLPPVPAE
jgi:predicted metal-binding protein